MGLEGVADQTHHAARLGHVLGSVVERDEEDAVVASEEWTLVRAHALSDVGGDLVELIANRRQGALYSQDDLVGLVDVVVDRRLQRDEELIEVARKEVDLDAAGEPAREVEGGQAGHEEGDAVGEHVLEHTQVGPPKVPDQAVHPGAGRVAPAGDRPLLALALASGVPSGGPASPIDVVGGQDEQALDQGGDQAGDHCLGEDRHELAAGTADQQHRDESRHRRADGRDHRPHDLLGAVDRGLRDRLALLDVPVDVLEHDDGIIDQHARDHHEADQAEQV